MADNVETIRRLEAAWAPDDYDTVREIIALDFSNGGPAAETNDPPNVEGVIKSVQAAGQAFSDRKQELINLFGEGARVVALVRFTGKNTGGLPWFGIPANGNEVDVDWITMYRLEDGRVAQTWGQMEVDKLMMQLGAMEGGS